MEAKDRAHSTPLDLPDMEARMKALLADHEGGFVRFLLHAGRGQANDVLYSDLTRSMAAGHWDAKAAKEWQASYAAKLAFTRNFTGVAGLAGGAPIIRALQASGATPGAWAPTAARIQTWVDNRSAELVKDITDDQREGLRAVFDKYIVGRPIGPRDMARHLRGIVGLTSQQMVSVTATRTRWEAEGVPGAKVDVGIDRLTHKLVAQRAETIARTELANAFNHANLTAIDQAVQAGSLDQSRVKKEWRTAEDERVCPECGPLDKVQVAFDADFVTKDGKAVKGPTLHPRCRCTIIIRLASYAGYVRKPQV